MSGRKKQKGFTIIELLVATTVFSIVLVIALAGILRVTQLYYRGITAARTQEVARSLIDELSESIRYSNNEVQVASNPATGVVVSASEVTADNTSFICIGDKRYTYSIDRQLKTDNPDWEVKEQRHVLWVDLPNGDDGNNDSCSSPADLSNESPSDENNNGRELLGENMRLAKFDIIPETVFGREAYTINVSVAYGDHAEDDYGGSLDVSSDGSSRTCQSNNSPFVGQFCNVSSYSVTVERRLQ